MAVERQLAGESHPLVEPRLLERPQVLEGPRLLVLRALGLGDLLTAVPALRGLARAFPDHRRVLLAPRSLGPLLALIRVPGSGAPVVHELRHSNLLTRDSLTRAAQRRPPFTGASLPLRGEGASVGPQSVEVAVNLHGRGPESHRVLLGVRPRRMVAFAHPRIPESGSGPRWRAGEHEVGRWCRMLAEEGVRCDPTELEIDSPPLPDGERWRGVTVVHPGASSAARRWPAERWAAVAAAERGVGRRVVITGSLPERPLATRIARDAGLSAGAVLAGRTDVEQLAGLVSVAGRVLCTDTGVGHLATALGTPSVLLFGPVSPAEWGPPVELRRHVVLWKGARENPHSDHPAPGLLRIKLADVLDALERLDRLRPLQLGAPR